MAETTLYDKYGQVVEEGDIIFKEGEEGDRMYIIQEGTVRISKLIAGKEHILAILEKGEFFGEMAIVNRTRRTATATAVADTRLLSFDRKGFQAMIEKNSKIALMIIDKLCRRIQKANQQIQHLVRKDKRGMIALNLYYAFLEHGVDVALLPKTKIIEDISVNLEIPQQTVATWIEDLIEAHIIVETDRKLKLADKTKLSTMAENAM
jgi:CRP-like cAMP-binding protein